MAMLTNRTTYQKRLIDLGLLLVYVLIFGFCAAHTTMDKRGAPSISWFGCFAVASAWAARVDARLKEAGSPRWYMFPIVYGAILLIGSIWMFKLMGGNIALALFFLTQIPIVFLPRRVSGQASHP